MTRPEAKKKSNAIWNFFSSVRLTILLLIILAIASIIGTLIPQQEEAMDFARGLSPALFRLFNSLDLFDMYHSLWFRLLIFLLASNLVICSIDRFSRTWRIFRLLPRPDRSKPFEGLPAERSFLAKGDIKDISGKLARFFMGRHYKTHDKKDASRYYLCGEKGKYSLFGVYLVHFSVLIILIGALVGSFFGFEAYVNIAEGEVADHVALRKGGTPLRLGFEVSCEKFSLDYYENGSPKEYRADLRFLMNGKEMDRKSVRVNHPVQFMGVNFYQSSYGTIPGNKVHLKIVRHGGEDRATTVEAETGKELQLPGNEGNFEVTRVDGNLMGVLGPAAYISIAPVKGEKVQFWIFQDQDMVQKRLPKEMKRLPKLNASAFAPYTFFLDRLQSRYYTGLQVNKDPGVPIVWTGCFLMVVGFFVTFFASHKRIWVRLSVEDTGTRIDIAGTASKNPVGLQREMEDITKALKNLFKEKR